MCKPGTFKPPFRVENWSLHKWMLTSSGQYCVLLAEKEIKKIRIMLEKSKVVCACNLRILHKWRLEN